MMKIQCWMIWVRVPRNKEKERESQTYRRRADGTSGRMNGKDRARVREGRVWRVKGAGRYD